MKSIFERTPNPLGKIAVVCGISACVLAWIPFLCVLKSPIGFLGILLALLGILSAVMSDRTSFFSPAGGLAVCLIPIVMFGGTSFKKENFDKITKGMAVSEVQKIMGSSGTCLKLKFPNLSSEDETMSEKDAANEKEAEIYFWRNGNTNYVISYNKDEKIDKKVIFESSQKPASNPELFTLQMLRQAMADEMANAPEISANPFASMFLNGMIEKIDEKIEKLAPSSK